MQNMKGAIAHLREHQKYPATRAELLMACESLSDFSAEDKQEFMRKLPDGTFDSAEDVMGALGWSAM